MKKIYTLLLATLLFPVMLTAQDLKPNFIRSGFYFLVGPVLPMGAYRDGQTIPFKPQDHPAINSLTYVPAKLGAALDMGYLIYIGPSFAHKILRAGIDATFISLWFNSTRLPSDTLKKNIEKYYSFAGQKFGPVLTINPVDRLMINLSYKLNFNIGYHDELDNWSPLTDSETSEYGISMTFQEISLGLSYRLIDFEFQYNFGVMDYNNVSNSNQDQKVREDTFRIMIGLKI
ncbi:MAG TPA: hypothetical protein VMC08_06300 [Bacteroidales bacterium]|nr:hypothetical protein [Bacteroidales bacterium]